MSNFQKGLIVASCVFYAATIYSFFTLETYIVVLFFLLHSLCLILFCYRTYMEVSGDIVSLETYHHDIGAELAEKDNMLAKLQESVEKRKDELRERLDRIEALELERDGLKGKVTELVASIEELKEKNDKKQQDALRENAYELLPAPDPGYDGMSPVNILGIAKNAKDELMGDARKAGMNINISSANELLFIYADPLRLKWLFYNIIDNSIKYMRKAGSLVITFSKIDEDIFIVCKDTGAGLKEEETRHIFELNYQGSNRVSGNGLGLAQARAIVEYYNGTIYARSTEGRGMGIYIQIPQGEPEVKEKHEH